MALVLFCSDVAEGDVTRRSSFKGDQFHVTTSIAHDKNGGMTATREAEEEIGLDPPLAHVVTSLEPFLSEVRAMMTNQDVHPVAASPPSPTQQLLLERLKAYENMYGSLDDYYAVGMGPSLFSSSSDLQTLESNFRRLGVSDSNARQQPLFDHRRGNQFPFNGQDRGINVYDSYNPWYFQSQTEQEQLNLAQRLWFRKDNRVNRCDAYKSYNYGSHGSSNSGVMCRLPYIDHNRNLVEVPFPPSNHKFYDQNPWNHSHGYVSGTHTNHNPYTMNNSGATHTNRLNSTELQNVIIEGSRETIDKIFDELISHVCELMIDPTDHEVVQKLLRRCTSEQISQVLDTIIQQPIRFVRICGDLHGTRALQVLMQCLCSEEQISRFMVALSHVALVLSKTTNANHVIMFCFSYFSPSQTNCLLQVIVQNCYQVAIDQFGCCMLQQCIGKSPREIRDPLISEIITYALSLCVNSYGNYVVQYVLELEDCQVAAALSRYLDGNYVQLSCDKYGSHAVQKCLKSKQFNSRKIIDELLSGIDSLLVNPYGNYVIQTAWVVSQDDMRSELLHHINKNHLLMRCNRYGRKVLEKLNL